MAYTHQRITIVRISRPKAFSINDELQWFGSSLGLFGERDKDKSCFRLFISLMKASRRGEPMTSNELSDELQLSRGTVVHHLNKLMEAGLVTHNRGKYMLRVTNLELLVEEVERDMARTLLELKQIAKDIDSQLRS